MRELFELNVNSRGRENYLPPAEIIQFSKEAFKNVLKFGGKNNHLSTFQLLSLLTVFFSPSYK